MNYTPTPTQGITPRGPRAGCARPPFTPVARDYVDRALPAGESPPAPLSQDAIFSPFKGKVTIVASVFEHRADLAQGYITFTQQAIGPGVRVRIIFIQTAILDMDISDGIAQCGQCLARSFAGAIGVVSIPEHFNRREGYSPHKGLHILTPGPGIVCLKRDSDATHASIDTECVQYLCC